MRRDSGRQEQHTVQCQRITRGKCRFDVPDVDGIERAAENSDACAEAHSAKFISAWGGAPHPRGGGVGGPEAPAPTPPARRGLRPTPRLGRLRGPFAPLRSLAGALCAPPLCGSANEILVAGRITV